MSKPQSDHINSHEVTIFRTQSFLQKAQTKDTHDYLSMSKMSIGSYYESVNSQKVGSGLNFDEEKLLLPNIIDLPAEDRDFRKKLTEFFAELTTPVPYNGGVTLEIGLIKSNKEPLSATNMPIKLMDYIRYRHALKNPEVAPSKDLADGNQMIVYYIFDPEMVQEKHTKSTKDKDAALQIYLQIKTDTDKVSTMLTLMGVDIREFYGQKEKDALMIQALRNLAETKPTEFLKEFDEKDMEIRGDLQIMVNLGVLKQYGQKYVDAESNDPLGNSVAEMISFFKDDDNSGLVMALQARKQEAADNNPKLTKTKKKTVVK